MGGPGLGGYIYTLRQRQRTPLFMATAVQVANACLIAFYLEESCKPSQRVPKIRWSKANPVGMVMFFLSRKFLILFGIMSLLDSLSQQLFIATIQVYPQAVFAFSVKDRTAVMVTFGMGVMVTMVIVLRPLIQRFGVQGVIKLGYVVTTTAYLSFAISFYLGQYEKDNEEMKLQHPGRRLIYLNVLYLAFGFISNPTQLSLACTCVEVNEQGRLQGANGSLDTIGKILGPLLVALVFTPSAELGHPNAIFWIVTLIMLPGVWIAFNLNSYIPGPRISWERKASYASHASTTSYPRLSLKA